MDARRFEEVLERGVGLSLLFEQQAPLALAHLVRRVDLQRLLQLRDGAGESPPRARPTAQ